MAPSSDLSYIKSALEKAERQIRSGRNYQEAIDLLTPLLDKLRKSKQTDYLMTALGNLGICFFELGQLAKARTCLEEGLNIARTGADQARTSIFLHELSLVASREGRLSDSLSLCLEALSLGLEAESDVGSIILHMAVLHQILKKFGEAEEILGAVRANCERSFDIQLLARILHEVGLVKFELEKYQEGVQSLIDSIHYKRILGDIQGIRKSLHVLEACLMRFPSAMMDPEVKRILEKATL